MNAIDRELLRFLWTDATLPIAELAQCVNLSQTPCWKRVQRLKDTDVIRAQVALRDARKPGVGTTMFVAVHTDRYTEKWAQRFTQVIRNMPGVVEAYRMSDKMDYLLRIAMADIEDYGHMYKYLIKSAPLSDVSLSLSMEQIKYSTALPVRDVEQED